MNITIVQTFTDGFTTYQSGQELSVPSEVAQRWIADGKAQADTDGQQSWLSSTEVAATRALVSGAWNASDGKRAVVIGDSICASGCNIEDFDPTVLNPAVGQYSLRARGWVNALNLLLGQPLDVIYWGAITGQVEREISARQDAVMDRPFDVLFDNGGTNDVSLFATEHGGSLTTCENAVVASRIARWDAALTRYGAKVIIALDCLPVGSSSGYTTAQKQCLLRINARLAEAARSRPGVRWVNGTAALIDPTSAGGLVKAGTLWDNDRHPGAYGAWLIAKEALRDATIASLATQRPVLSSQLDCIQSDAASKNILHTDTGLVLGSTGAASGAGMSGTVIQRLTGSRNFGSGAAVAASIVAAPNGIGNAQRFTITSAVASDQVRALILPAITVTEFPKGSWGYFECMVKVSSGVNLQNVAVVAGVNYVGGTPAPNLASGVMSLQNSEIGVGGIVEETMYLRTPPVYFPADATSLTFVKGEIFSVFGGAGGAVLDMYCMRWVKL